MAKRGCARPACVGFVFASLAVAAVLIGPMLELQSLMPMPMPSSQVPAAAAADQTGGPGHLGGQPRLGRAAMSASLHKALAQVDKNITRSLDAKIDAAVKRLSQRSSSDSGESDILEKVETLVNSKMEAVLESIETKIDKDLWLAVDRQLDNKLDKRIVTKLEKTLKTGSFGLPVSVAKKPDSLGEKVAPPAVVAGQPIVVVQPAQQAAEVAPAPLPAEDGRPASGATCKATDVSTAPKDWCGRTDKKPCMDSWETQYMMKHASQLSEGLEAIRSPGCFPRGRSIAAMGYYRTGSTLLYNTVRLWAALGAGDSLVAGFMCKDPEKLGIGVPGTPQEGCTSVCKDHTWHTGNPEHTDVILMSRRDPQLSVCSRKLMGQWCKMGAKPGKKEPPPSQYAQDEYSRKCLKDDEMERVEAIAQCHDLMKMQAAIYFERVILKKEIAYDVLMEAYEEDPAREVKAVGHGMGICKEAAENQELVQFIVEMGKQLKKNPGADMGITQMHDVHTSSQRNKECSNLEAYMSSDEECKAWMDGKAAIETNAELKKMEINPPKRQRLGKK